LTADQLGRLIHQSRMKISRLENAQIRPDLAEIMSLLEAMDVTGDRWDKIIRIARDATARGWWDVYGNSMGDRQKLYADIESGAATIREYHPTAMPGLLQSPEYTRALINDAIAEGPVTYDPERLVRARGQRQLTVFCEDGPTYEVIVDEVGLRRFSVPTEVMYDQLGHLGHLSEQQSRITVRVLPLVTGRTNAMLPKSAFFLYTFPDPCDPPLAVEESDSADHIHIASSAVSKYVRRYESVRDAALPEEDSRTLLREIAEQLIDTAGTNT
jgi:transcriptional regulator with XRE-family HTH domain